MTLLIVALAGVCGLVGILGLLDRAWRRADAVRFIPPGALIGSAEDREREATADLFAGRVGRARYRAVLASLADESEAVLSRPER